MSWITSEVSTVKGVPCNKILDERLQRGRAEEKMMQVMTSEIKGSV